MAEGIRGGFMKMIIFEQVLQVQAWIKCGRGGMEKTCLKRINAAEGVQQLELEARGILCLLSMEI